MRCPWSVWGWGGVPMNPLTILKPKSKGVSCPHCYISGLGCAFSLQFEHDIQTNDWAWFMDEKGKMREHFYLIFTTVRIQSPTSTISLQWNHNLLVAATTKLTCISLHYSLIVTPSGDFALFFSLDLTKGTWKFCLHAFVSCHFMLYFM
jgi:hypothetical protein